MKLLRTSCGVQDMLGHKTDKMARRYAGAAWEETAAKMMPKYSVL